jgi:hypothetical protein
MLQTKEISKDARHLEIIFREATATMNFIDCLLLTVGNIVLCLSFPKLLSLILAPKTKQAKSVKPALTLPTVEIESKAPSFS